jgi:tetratricopeptide repeat protein 8
MLTEPGGPFIDVSKLNLSKYAHRPALAKALFEYLFYHEADMRAALELASAATEACQFKSWWWKVQLGKCYYRLGMYREAEQQFLSSLKQFETLDTFLLLGKVHVKLDQPLAAIENFKKGLSTFPKDVSLLTGVARIYEGIGEMEKAVDQYRNVLEMDSTNIEAIACLGTHHFYSDQPEIALRYYRRLLQMGVYNTEVFLNLGLCCFYAQQYDIALNCLLRALSLASDEQFADVWYNIGHVALGVGDSNMAYQCFKLSLVYNNTHPEALNNLGVLEWKMGHGEVVRAAAYAY